MSKQLLINTTLSLQNVMRSKGIFPSPIDLVPNSSKVYSVSAYLLVHQLQRFLYDRSIISSQGERSIELAINKMCWQPMLLGKVQS